MKIFRNEILPAIIFLVASSLGYLLHYLIFRDAHHIFIYMIGDISFVFIEVFLVTLVIHRLLDDRDRKCRLVRQNMVIGAFYSEVGKKLLTNMLSCDSNLQELKEKVLHYGKWTTVEFSEKLKWLNRRQYSFKEQQIAWAELKDILVSRRDFLLRLFENSTLLEHELFSELLQATFHLLEELEARTDIADLPQSDIAHLAFDVNRVYDRLVRQWFIYMRHLKKEYPYLFSLALRQNPFDENASVIING